jgi:CBS domain-containing protein
MICARDIMTCDVLKLTPETTIREAMELLSTNHLSGAPVVAGEHVVGVVSMMDILGLLMPAEGSTPSDEAILDQRTVAEAMNHTVFSVSPAASVRSVATMMREHGIHRVVVIETGVLAGIISSLDIARAVSEKGLSGRTGIFREPACDTKAFWITR